MSKEDMIALFAGIMEEELEKDPEKMDLELIDLCLAVIYPDYADTYVKLWVEPKKKENK